MTGANLTSGDDSGEDVNARVTAEWVEETTPFERVRTVMKRTYEPQSATETADRAQTTPTTARKHLKQLVDSGFVEQTSTPHQEATLYRRSNESLVLEQARNILDEVGTDELVSRIAAMQADVRTYREQFDAESPEDAVLEDRGLDRETLRDWQTTRRNLGIAKAALALDEAEETVRTTQTG